MYYICIKVINSGKYFSQRALSWAATRHSPMFCHLHNLAKRSSDKSKDRPDLHPQAFHANARFFFSSPPFCTPHQSNRAPLDPFVGSEGEPARLFRARKLEHGAQLRPKGWAGLRQALPSRVDATAVCWAQLNMPHHLRSQPARLAWRSAWGARGARTRRRSRISSSANLTCQHYKTLWPWTQQFGVAFPFSSARCSDSRTILTGSAWVWGAVGSQRRDQGDVAAQCGAMLEGPYTTKSNLRLSSSRTPGSVVRASHCCGTPRLPPVLPGILAPMLVR